MRLKLLVLGTLFISLAVATELPHRIKPLSTVLAEEENQHPFGKAMSSLIQMTMQSNEPSARLSAISDMLLDIQSSSITRDQRENQKCQDKSDWCVVTKNDARTQLVDAQGRLRDANEEESELRDELSEKRANLDQERSNLDQLNTDKAHTEQQIEEENASFTEHQGNYDSLIIACEEGIRLMKRMVHGEVNFGRQAANFIQISDIKKKIVNAKQKFSEEHQKQNLGILEPVVAVLTTLSTQAQFNYENLMNCLNLINEILERLRRDLITLERRHNQSIEDLNTLLESLNAQLASTYTIIEIYQERIDDITARLGELDTFISDTTQIAAQLQRQLDETTADCDESANTCSLEGAKRQQEL